MQNSKKIIQQYSEFKIVWKTRGAKADQPQFANSSDIATFLHSIWDFTDPREKFYLLALTRQNKLIGFYPMSIGGMTGTICDPPLLFIATILTGGRHIIIAHNHPSGELKPSRADESITVKIRDGARLLDITLIDHIILGCDQQYYSFADNGALL